MDNAAHHALALIRGIHFRGVLQLQSEAAAVVAGMFRLELRLTSDQTTSISTPGRSIVSASGVCHLLRCNTSALVPHKPGMAVRSHVLKVPAAVMRLVS